MVHLRLLMADTYDAATRSAVMRSVKTRDTRPEILLRKAMYAIGLRGWRCHRTDLPGKPDVAFGRMRLAVFVDGAFWHGHPSKYWRGRSGAYWDKKIEGNIARDQAANEQLTARGWNVIRLWDFEVTADPRKAAKRIRDALDLINNGQRVMETHHLVLADAPQGGEVD